MKTRCKRCNKELPKNRKTYCSKECVKKEQKILYCKQCRNPIPIRNKRRITFCSNECHQASYKGIGNPMYSKVSAMKGRLSAMFGKTHKESTITKMSLSHKNHPSYIKQIEAARKTGRENKKR